MALAGKKLKMSDHCGHIGTGLGQGIDLKAGATKEVQDLGLGLTGQIKRRAYPISIKIKRSLGGLPGVKLAQGAGRGVARVRKVLNRFRKYETNYFNVHCQVKIVTINLKFLKYQVCQIVQHFCRLPSIHKIYRQHIQS